jgi:N-acetylmuramoyl-L-alanine amidase
MLLVVAVSYLIGNWLKSRAEKKAQSKESERKEANASPESSVQPPQPGQTSAASPAPASSHTGELPRVTGIRHWSTPDYTRVAIDVEAEVKFASQRIGHPERIFFDLRDTRLASTLVGKSFDVDDGLLKKIRVAQFQPGRTRVVLEVDDLSKYNAFLLPNPYRLIIDIHGRDDHGKNGRGRARSQKEAAEVASTGDVEAGPRAGSGSDPEAAAADPKRDAPAETKTPVTPEAANNEGASDGEAGTELAD